MSSNNLEFVKQVSEAILREDSSVTLHTGEVIKLPKPQKCGTEWQKKTYADTKACDILDRIRNEV